MDRFIESKPELSDSERPGTVQSVSIHRPNRDALLNPADDDPANLAVYPGDRYVEVRLAGHEVVYYVRAAITADGPALLALTMQRIDGGPITHDDLRRVPAKRLAAAAAQMHINPRDKLADVDLPRLTLDQLVSEPEATPQRQRGRPRRSADELREVARIAKSARNLGLPMHKAVAEQLHISESTARHAIRQATDAGYRKRTKPSQKPGGAEQ